MENNCDDRGEVTARNFSSFVETYDTLKGLFAQGFEEEEIVRVTKVDIKEVKKYKSIWLNAVGQED